MKTRWHQVVTFGIPNAVLFKSKYTYYDDSSVLFYKSISNNNYCLLTINESFMYKRELIYWREYKVSLIYEKLLTD